MAYQNYTHPSLADDPLWYKDAIIYELHVRAFNDSNADGIGDFRGLIKKLDYLQDLGVTALWLLPFYPSPLRDDGYDTSDYMAVNPSYGTLRDFKAFLREAARRGLRVITELVVNHTSDQHPWFQRARKAPPGSRWRDFYVWSNTPERYRDARIIFQDFESSNWSWDTVAKAYFWHRFYAHQPDLNYDKPYVRQAIMRVMDFWMKMGVSGMRLDAVPYLFEREGTSCENLPETHDFLKAIRRHLDERFPHRMLLAEANQWPEDTATYFGDGDECHMAFHFPVMPRLFMALSMEDSLPILDIIEQTPTIPENSQWAMFLRNHDELTLEMVTDAERDYMNRMYAVDHNARINLGIRRRLAPLLRNDRKKIELINSLLFALPGTPIVYYGDEIGMGDNFYLGDRNAVRTPMQWSPDRNAGFSQANEQRLYLPVITDSEYHYETINVEAQQQNPDSLLWWMKRMIGLRKRFKAFSRGSLEFLQTGNRKVLGFLRRYQGETILVLANLSRQAQYAYIDLSEFAGINPSGLAYGAQFPRIEQSPYLLTFGPYGFYWFSLAPRVEQIKVRTPPAAGAVPVLTVSTTRDSLFTKEHQDLLQECLLPYIEKSRFGRKGQRTQSMEVLDVVPLSSNASLAHLVLVNIEYLEGEPEIYVLPLILAPQGQAQPVLSAAPQSLVARVRPATGAPDREHVLYDALADHEFCQTLLRAMSRHRRFQGEHGELVCRTTPMFRQLRGTAATPLDVIPLTAVQSNISVRYGERFILKLFRRLREGVNPDLEIGRYLTEKQVFSHIAPLAGALEYQRQWGEEALTIGILQGFVPNQGDAWRATLDAIQQYFERVSISGEREGLSVPAESLLVFSMAEPPDLAQHLCGPSLAAARLLGQRTAELHTALAAERENPDFAPEPFVTLYRHSLYQSMRKLILQVFGTLRTSVRCLSDTARATAERVLEQEQEALRRAHGFLERSFSGMRIRCHGDYHLGQVLCTPDNDFVIIDFEGKPTRSIGERRLKHSPIKDVAGMIRSLHYAAHTALLHRTATQSQPPDQAETWAMFWYSWVAASFLKAYLHVASQGDFLPQDQGELSLLLDLYLLEKAIYEVDYEVTHRPDWVHVPLQGLVQLLG